MKVPLGLGGLKMTMNFEKLEEREPEFASMRAKGQGVGALMDMKTSFTLSEAGGGTSMAWEADVKIAGPVGAMGQRVLQPIVNQQVSQVLEALEKRVEHSRVTRRRAGIIPLAEAYEAEPEGPTHSTRVLTRRAAPFRIGVMQLTMEPLEEMLESARVMDRAGMDTIWLAEAYPWWRKHGMEARSSTVVSALMARETERLTIGWGIISPFTRHPVQVAMDARVVQEAAGPGRFLLGFGTSKIFLNNIRSQTSKTLGPMRDAVDDRARRPRRRAASSTRATRGARPCRGCSADAHTPRDVPPVYVAATAPKMQALAGEIADGCLTPSITTPAFVGYTRENVAADIDIGCTVVASIHESDRDAGRDGAREIAGMYLANKFQNIRGSADTLLELAGIEHGRSSRRSPRRWSGAAGSRRRPKVTDSLLDRCKPIAGTPGGLHRARSRSTATRAARTSCSSSGATAATTRSASSARRCSRTSVAELRIDETGSSTGRSRAIATPSFTGSEQAMAELMRETFRRHGPAGAVAAGRGRPRQRRSARGREPAAGRASCSTATWTRRTRAGSRGSRTCPASSRARSSRTAGSTGSGSRT